MFTRILVPLDGSARAERALPVAARVARAGGGTLLLTMVVSPVPVIGAPLEIPRDMAAYIDGEIASAKEYLARVSRHSELAGVKTEAIAAVGAPIANELIELAQGSAADVIVMCSHGRTGFVRWALGSVAQHVVRSASIPVLVLKADGPDLARAGDNNNAPSLRVLIPLDGSPVAESAIEPAAQLAAALSAPGTAIVHLLQVIEYPVLTYPAFTPAALPRASATEGHQLQDQATSYLKRVAQRFAEEPLKSLGVQVRPSVVFDEDTASAITAAADHATAGDDTPTVAIDLIAMATHGRTGLGRMALGSVTERVLLATKCPLFVVRPDLTARQGEPALRRRHPATAEATDVAVAPLF